MPELTQREVLKTDLNQITWPHSQACGHYGGDWEDLKESVDSSRAHGHPHPPTLTTSMTQMVVLTSLGWDTMISEVANTFTRALSFCSVTEGGLGTWILMVRGRDSGYCWNTCGETPGQTEQAPEEWEVPPWLPQIQQHHLSLTNHSSRLQPAAGCEQGLPL